MYKMQKRLPLLEAAFWLAFKWIYADASVSSSAYSRYGHQMVELHTFSSQNLLRVYQVSKHNFFHNSPILRSFELNFPADL